jgi:cytochrome c peroxidase
MRHLLLGALSMLVIGAGVYSYGQLSTAAPNFQWTAQELATLNSLKSSPNPVTDASNRYLHNAAAAELGQHLFFDKRFSRNAQIACTSCHQPDKQFADGLAVASALATGTRNTPSLLGVAKQHWFFWDGRKDSLWSQALAPWENPQEHGFTRTEAVKLLATDSYYVSQYTTVFNTVLPSELAKQLNKAATPLGDLSQLQAWKQLSDTTRQQVDQIYANMGKALAAYIATLQAPASRFDHYLQQLTQAETNPATLNTQELAGARLFIGKAQCILCHSGAQLSNLGFQNIGSGVMGKDSGRAAVLDEVRVDRFNCLGEFSDAKPEQCAELNYMTRDRHSVLGAFKVPSLRNVANTAPYFHDGRFASLESVVAYYVKVSHDATLEKDLPAINLSADEQRQLLAFLQTL